MYHFKDGLLRGYLPNGGKLTITLTVHPKISNENLPDREQLIESLKALGLLGGLGSRSRKGLGSLAIEALHEDTKQLDIPHDIASLKDWLNQHKYLSNLPPFSAFSDKTRTKSMGSDSIDPTPLIPTKS
ncbi:MAG: hypothetical protein JXK51_03820 [Halothiobacillaceae bacterium]|nr:hypothetical protein [Halothiobacillaceae bacterium]